MCIGTVRFSDKFQMEVIIPIPMEWRLWSEQGTCMPLCSCFKCTWWRERCNFLTIISWHVPVTTQHEVCQQIVISCNVKYHTSEISCTVEPHLTCRSRMGTCPLVILATYTWKMTHRWGHYRWGFVSQCWSRNPSTLNILSVFLMYSQSRLIHLNFVCKISLLVLMW